MSARSCADLSGKSPPRFNRLWPGRAGLRGPGINSERSMSVTTGGPCQGSRRLPVLTRDCLPASPGRFPLPLVEGLNHFRSVSVVASNQ